MGLSSFLGGRDDKTESSERKHLELYGAEDGNVTLKKITKMDSAKLNLSCSTNTEASRNCAITVYANMAFDNSGKNGKHIFTPKCLDLLYN